MSNFGPNVIKLDAGNDKNGNPRRVFVALNSEGTVIHAWDEGYQSFNAVPTLWRKQAQLCSTFRTTPAEYRTLLRNFG